MLLATCMCLHCLGQKLRYSLSQFRHRWVSARARALMSFAECSVCLCTCFATCCVYFSERFQLMMWFTIVNNILHGNSCVSNNVQAKTISKETMLNRKILIYHIIFGSRLLVALAHSFLLFSNETKQENTMMRMRRFGLHGPHFHLGTAQRNFHKTCIHKCCEWVEKIFSGNQLTIYFPNEW